MVGLVREFEARAVHIGRTIVEELHLSQEDKTIKACDVGGQAGGQKYPLLCNYLLTEICAGSFMRESSSSSVSMFMASMEVPISPLLLNLFKLTQ